jgi:hypothetical protein
MKKYGNASGNSGVMAYEIGADWIKIKFRSDDSYTYSYTGAGMKNVEEMKKLAVKGEGLATYINKYVRDLYD